MSLTTYNSLLSYVSDDNKRAFYAYMPAWLYTYNSLLSYVPAVCGLRYRARRRRLQFSVELCTRGAAAATSTSILQFSVELCGVSGRGGRSLRGDGAYNSLLSYVSASP